MGCKTNLLQEKKEACYLSTLIRTARENGSVTKSVKLDYPNGLDSTGVTNILKVHRHKKYTGAQVLYYHRHALFVVFKNLMMQICFFNTLTNAIPTLSLEWKQKQMGNCLF